MNVSKVFLDTNVLIYQTFDDFDEEKHRIVNRMLQRLHACHWELYISSQIIREFVAIATNEKIFQTPLQSSDVVLKIDEFQKNFRMLFDTEGSVNILKDLINRYHIKRYAIHDANIAAVVIANKLDYLWTFNRKDFDTFDKVRFLQEDQIQ